MARARKTLPARVAPEPKPPVPPEEEVLGRNLAAAYIAMQHGIGMDYARKKYAHEPVGQFWISVARMVVEHFARHAPRPPRDPVTIQ
jgi:hypothetical protein